MVKKAALATGVPSAAPGTAAPVTAPIGTTQSPTLVGGLGEQATIGGFGQQEPLPTQQCKVLAGTVGKLMQGLLFVCCVAALVFKYRRESGDRSPQEFVMDSSKQLIGAGWIHVLNIGFSKGLESHFQTGDECQWYWLNIVLDCTLGVAVEYVLMLAMTSCIQKSCPSQAEDFETGDYKNADGAVQPGRYVKQLLLWLVIVSLMKLSMGLIMSTGHAILLGITKALLAPVASNATLELFTVMILTPICMNVFQFWMVDNFIKKKGGQSDDGNSGDWEMDGSMRTRMQHGDM